MKTFLLCIIAVLAGSIPGCQSSQVSATKPLPAQEKSSARQTGKIDPRPTNTEATCIVEAVVESIQPINDIRFMVGLFILKSTSTQGSGHLLEPTQEVIASPRFVADPSGTIDTMNAVNKSFLRLRTMLTGTTIRGMLSVDHRGSWELVTIDDR